MTRARRLPVVLGLGLALNACGGVAHRDRDTPSESSGGTSGGGAASGGNTGTAAAGATTTPTGPRASNSFDSPSVLAGIGLWMELGGALPIGDPPIPHDGSALHLVGDSGAGLDFFFHTPFPVEQYFSAVHFWAESELPGAALTIAVAGPYPTYFKDRDQGLSWPTRVVGLSLDWREFDVPFSSLGIDKTHPGPHEEMFGAVHFIVEPNVHYDFWIDDFNLPSAR